jgi:gluconokinase
VTTSIVLMGVSGAGKSTIGPLVAARLGVPFLDADDFHDQSSIAAMRAGIALDDSQRQPWLHRLNRLLDDHRTSGVVLGCSALKRSYRDVLRHGLDDLRFVQLTVRRSVLEARLWARTGHYAGAALLPSQLATLEPGDDVVTVNGELPPDAVADEVLDAAAAPRANVPGNRPIQPGTRH